jgi:murein DD-endopeptidase MepM/ murein hydrolase activator NlpD
MSDIKYHFNQAPLDRCKITQPFGVDWIDGKTYSGMGLKGHNGLDFSARIGTSLYAVADGYVEKHGSLTDNGYGLSAWLYHYIENDYRLEIINAHLSDVIKIGNVKQGEVIAKTGNSGFSTGPHLHFGVRPQILQNGKWTYDSANGYAGCINPQPMFDKETFYTPAAKRYGQPRDLKREVAFVPSYLWFIRHFGPPKSNEDYNALVYGYWDARSIIDPAMYSIWSEMTKPQALKSKIIS